MCCYHTTFQDAKSVRSTNYNGIGSGSGTALSRQRHLSRVQKRRREKSSSSSLSLKWWRCNFFVLFCKFQWKTSEKKKARKAAVAATSYELNNSSTEAAAAEEKRKDFLFLSPFSTFLSAKNKIYLCVHVSRSLSLFYPRRHCHFFFVDWFSPDNEAHMTGPCDTRIFLCSHQQKTVSWQTNNFK